MVERYQKMKNIQRLSGSFKLRSYNLIEHSFMVTVLFKEFCKKEHIYYDISTLDLVMNHDILESETGDLIYTVKNLNEETQKAWAQVEEQVCMANVDLAKYSDENIEASLDEQQMKMFKVCDLLELWLFCKEEESLGNKNLEKVINNCQKLIHGKFKSVDKFILNYSAK